MNDEDQLWIDTLAGRGTEPTTPLEREAAAFRRGMLNRAIDANAPPPELDRIETLIARARHDGLLRDRRVRAPLWLSDWRGLAAVFLVGVAAIGIGVLNAPTRQEETVRSARPDVVVLRAADPDALAAEIVDALIAVGIDAVGYDRLQGRGIDAELPQPVPDAAREVLARYGVPVPRDGVLQIEVDAMP